MASTQFLKDQLIAILTDGDYECLNIITESLTENTIEMIFKNEEGRFFKCIYTVDVTELTEDDDPFLPLIPFENEGQYISCQEVKPWYYVAVRYKEI